MGIFSRKAVDVSRLRLDQAWADPELDRAYAAVRAGDLSTGMALLKATPVNTGLRSVRVVGLGQAAVGHSEQLELRLEALPGDADLLLWLGQTLVFEAWEVRSGSLAKYVSEQQFASFHDVLGTAGAVLNHAIDAAPDDAAPWEVLQWVTVGPQSSMEVKDKVFRSAVDRHPDSYAAHSGRVQVLAPKWSGLELAELVHFGHQVVANAQPGSALCAVAAQVINEVWVDVLGDSELSRLQRGARLTHEVSNRREELLAARDKWWTPGREQQPEDISAHGAMAFALKAVGAKAAAMEHAALTTGRIESLPWGYTNAPDPLTAFATAVAHQMS
ncbi:hypothetical protein [Kribbella sp. NBC_00889]|uniref:hypothetical protein n=1 Tax=Kribbella sp. NBC_00889 TaxID=2975974 RepID=UPI00386D1CA6|nr:hypothetical protein OG817_06140 [Kribbella sp. NBC_00889]